jgi:hypothetical protein
MVPRESSLTPSGPERSLFPMMTVRHAAAAFAWLVLLALVALLGIVA